MNNFIFTGLMGTMIASNSVLANEYQEAGKLVIQSLAGRTFNGQLQHDGAPCSLSFELADNQSVSVAFSYTPENEEQFSAMFGSESIPGSKFEGNFGGLRFIQSTQGFLFNQIQHHIVYEDENYDFKVEGVRRYSVSKGFSEVVTCNLNKDFRELND